MKTSELTGGKLDYSAQREAMTTHGMTGTPTYTTWERMKSRCLSSKWYLSKGITVCDKWQTFEGFYEDMGERPVGMTIDRIDNSKGYYKENCRWVDHKTQCQNRDTNINITFNGKTQCLAEWAREVGIKKGTLWWRYKNGWSVERMLTTC